EVQNFIQLISIQLMISSWIRHRSLIALVGRHTRLSFLRNMVGTHTLMLYVSEWSEKQLVKCSINNDPVATASYLFRCHQTRPESLVELSLFNIRALLSPDNLCPLSPVDGFIKQTKNYPLEQQHISGAKSRRKRAWVFPGTLWCGTGSKAIDYKQLGMFERADGCCREHDHCSNTIPSFTVNYGVFNPNFFTISHCDCDKRFRQCLQRVNDTISNMVGFSFFNLLKMPCFEFTPRSQCTENNVVCVSDIVLIKSLHFIMFCFVLCVTDNMLLCGTLKHLDECKYKIPPLEKRYDLHNMGSKTVYHCDFQQLQTKVSIGQIQVCLSPFRFHIQTD
uniref:phospholipase A2 n=1 Tax=Oncorhynchus mykiss TaxID=8022 RepID=A0A8C7LRC8_ONCMY